MPDWPFPLFLVRDVCPIIGSRLYRLCGHLPVHRRPKIGSWTVRYKGDEHGRRPFDCLKKLLLVGEDDAYHLRAAKWRGAAFVYPIHFIGTAGRLTLVVIGVLLQP